LAHQFDDAATQESSCVGHVQSSARPPFIRTKGTALREVVVVSAARTPIGKRDGQLSSMHPADLSAVVLNAVVDRAGVDPGCVEDVIWGCVSQVGDQSLNIARTAVLAAGWPQWVPATTVDRQCGSSQQAVSFAAAAVAAEQADIIVAGGVESMSRVPMFSSAAGGEPQPYSVNSRYGFPTWHQGWAAEAMARRWSLSRRILDEYSVTSHAKASAAADRHDFAAELVEIKNADGVCVSRDEGIRPDTALEKLASLAPAFAEDGLIHAGNASQISDGAAAVLVMSRDKARELGVEPLVIVRAHAVVADDPVAMLTAPVPATQKVLARSGLTVDDIDLFEVNEAFAPVPLAWMHELQVDEHRLNVNGGAIALGHPLGASGARVMVTLIHAMRLRGVRLGLQTMCEAGGMANATVLELA
jgi:acetyl-CoA acyltransferase